MLQLVGGLGCAEVAPTSTAHCRETKQEAVLDLDSLAVAIAIHLGHAIDV
jgi:hypothetical protein